MATARYRLGEFGPASLALAAAAVLILACATGRPPADSSRVERDFYYRDGRVSPLLVALDSLAVLSSDSVFERDVERGARLARTSPGGRLRFFGLPAPRPRGDLVRIAREIRARLRGGGQAGFVAWPLEASQPLVVTDFFIARFRSEVADEQIAAWNRRWGVETVRASRLVSNRFLLRVTEASGADALTVANRYYESPLTEYAHPNFLRSIEPRDTLPDDPLLAQQWHLHNVGQGGGTADADIDAPEAWDFTMGEGSVVIAILDGGFDLAHPELADRWWRNPDEIDANGADDDSNDYVDDVTGWDFTKCVEDPDAGCGDSIPSGEGSANSWDEGTHGTVTAGAAGAAGNNGLGVTGVCPGCRVMPLRIPFDHDPEAVHRAVEYAFDQGAAVMSNSWGYHLDAAGTDDDTVVALNTASDEVSIFFAMTNPARDNCDPLKPDIASLAGVVAVGRSTNHDRREPAGFGECMDLLAPSAGPNTVSSGRGTLFAVSTDPTGAFGYNTTRAGAFPNCPSDLADDDYTRCFVGTSFSAPVAAGVAGLVLSADPTLDPLRVQRLLQDTADRVEPSEGRYRRVDGFSTGAVVPADATHGYGRGNAFEAVRIAARPSIGGKGGVDAFVRDNDLDWGNTGEPSFTRFESPRGFIGYWASPDIKVDAPPYHPLAVDATGNEIPVSAATFEAWPDEPPLPGAVNRIYVRVRNRGPAPIEGGRVKLLWTRVGTALPLLPGDFWSAFPAGSIDPASPWSPVDCRPYSGPATADCTLEELRYSGSSVAGKGIQDAAAVLRFEGILSVTGHACLLAIVDADQDRVQPEARPVVEAGDFVVDWLTPHDNNVALRNYIILDPIDVRPIPFVLMNPLDDPIRVRLRFQGSGEWRALRPGGEPVAFPLPLEAGAELELVLAGTPSGPEGEVDVIQEAVSVSGATTIMGGMTVRWRLDGEIPDP